MPGLALVRFNQGLVEHEPRWMCAADLKRLRDLASGPAFGSSVDERPWDVAVLETRGAFEERAA